MHPESFDTIIQSYLDNNVGLSKNFIPVKLISALKKHVLLLNDVQKFHRAGTGNKNAVSLQQNIRTDKIFWLDRAHENENEDAFLLLMDRFIAFLNMTCYTGITDSEFHFSIYEPGSFYTSHFDRFQNDSRRAFSMVHYLNELWQPGDGGELCVHHAGANQKIPPLAGTSVFFKSDELQHEVLLTNVRRLSITGWLKTN